MAKSKEKKNDKPMFSAKGMKVHNVRRLSDTVIAFSLLGNGLGLYNLKVIDGSKGKFIGTPSTKGKDGKWYDQYAVYFKDEEAAAIIKKVEAEAAEQDEDDEDEADDIPF